MEFLNHIAAFGRNYLMKSSRVCIKALGRRWSDLNEVIYCQIVVANSHFLKGQRLNEVIYNIHVVQVDVTGKNTTIRNNLLIQMKIKE